MLHSKISYCKYETLPYEISPGTGQEHIGAPGQVHNMALLAA